MTNIKKISGLYLLDIDTKDGVKYLQLSGVQMLALADEIHRFIKIEN